MIIKVSYNRESLHGQIYLMCCKSRGLALNLDDYA